MLQYFVLLLVFYLQFMLKMSNYFNHLTHEPCTNCQFIECKTNININDKHKYLEGQGNKKAKLEN